MHLQRGVVFDQVEPNQLQWPEVCSLHNLLFFHQKMQKNYRTTKLHAFPRLHRYGVFATRLPVSPFPALPIPRLCSFCSFCSFRKNTLLNQKHRHNYKTDYKTHCVVTAKRVKHIGRAAKCYSFF